MPEDSVAIVIGSDTDPIMPSLHNKTEITWDAVITNIFKLKNMIDQVNFGSTSQPRITWLLRSDTQMKLVFGDYAYPVNQYFDIWQNLHKQGDEIGWHPHFWNWSEPRNCWYPVLHNLRWIEACLEQGYSAISKYFKPTSVRVGFDFHSNYTMRKLADLEIIVDFSALPGLKVYGFTISDPPCYHDWEITQPDFYVPSLSDYRRSVINGESSLKILEMPISTIKVPIHKAIVKYLYHNAMYNLNMGFSGFVIPFKCQQLAPVQISYHSRYLRSTIETKFREAKQKECVTYLLSYFHPEDLGYVRTSEGIRCLNNFKKNLQFILKMSLKYQIPARFLTATEAAREYMSSLNGDLETT